MSIAFIHRTFLSRQYSPYLYNYWIIFIKLAYTYSNSVETFRMSRIILFKNNFRPTSEQSNISEIEIIFYSMYHCVLHCFYPSTWKGKFNFSVLQSDQPDRNCQRKAIPTNFLPLRHRKVGYYVLQWTTSITLSQLVLKWQCDSLVTVQNFQGKKQRTKKQ